MINVLETHNIEKKYKNTSVLKNLNMSIKKGAIYGLIGKNGSGKTTLIRIITGLQSPTGGTYSLYGVPYNDNEILDMRTRIGAIVETPSLYGNMSAKDNLIVQFKNIGIPSLDKINYLLKLVGLKNVGSKKVKYFSLGMKQRLGIAIALSSSPDFLILDEPINGLDPEGIIEIRKLILNLNKNGITILISSHYLDELSKIATHYGFLNDGKIINEISADELNKKMRKKMIIKVNNLKEAVKYFEIKNISYEVIDNFNINVYGEVNISKMVMDLSKKKCIIEKIHESNETLENYYINLIGSGNYD